MYKLRTNEEADKFCVREVNALDVGFFYEDSVKNRYLTFNDNVNGRYAVCISSVNPYTPVGKYFGKYDKLNVRLVKPGTEFIFTQGEPIPF